MAPFVALTRRPIASMVAASLLRGGPLTTGATDVCGSTELSSTGRRRRLWHRAHKEIMGFP